MRAWAGSRTHDRSRGVVLVGFASDEGVRRNHGRTGAADGPASIRATLASLSDPGLRLFDAGDVVVEDGELEAAQVRLGGVVRGIREAGLLPVVLGGGHEVAFGSYLGWAGGDGWGILNLDAHFDLREPGPGAASGTSGTPFRQAAAAEGIAGRGLPYAVVGLSRANNTRVLFDTADSLHTTYLIDEACDPESVRRFVRGFLTRVDRVHLSLDLDVLPAAVAPGVSAPAGFGIGLDAVRAAMVAVAASGKLGLLEVAELNPRFDVDARTARTAARLVDEVVRNIAS